VSGGRNTIIAQHVETYKIEALNNNLIVIVMFRTATNASINVELLNSKFLACWKELIDGRKETENTGQEE